MSEDVRALSVRRPWANLLVSGDKTVENRSWSTSYRGLLCIHGGQRWDSRGGSAAHDLVGIADVRDRDFPGGYLGTVRLVDVHEADGCCYPWGHSEGFHWVVESPRRFAEPIPGIGRLGLCRLPVEVAEQIVTVATPRNAGTPAATYRETKGDTVSDMRNIWGNNPRFLDRKGRVWIARNGLVSMVGAKRKRHIDQPFEDMRYLYELMPA